MDPLTGGNSHSAGDASTSGGAVRTGMDEGIAVVAGVSWEGLLLTDLLTDLE